MVVKMPARKCKKLILLSLEKNMGPEKYKKANAME